MPRIRLAFVVGLAENNLGMRLNYLIQRYFTFLVLDLYSLYYQRISSLVVIDANTS